MKALRKYDKSEETERWEGDWNKEQVETGASGYSSKQQQQEQEMNRKAGLQVPRTPKTKKREEEEEAKNDGEKGEGGQVPGNRNNNVSKKSEWKKLGCTGSKTTKTLIVKKIGKKPSIAGWSSPKKPSCFRKCLKEKLGKIFRSASEHSPFPSWKVANLWERRTPKRRVRKHSTKQWKTKLKQMMCCWRRPATTTWFLMLLINKTSWTLAEEVDCELSASASKVKVSVKTWWMSSSFWSPSADKIIHHIESY